MLGGDGVRLHAVLMPHLQHWKEGWGVFYRLNVNADVLMAYYLSSENITIVSWLADMCEQKSRNPCAYMFCP